MSIIDTTPPSQSETVSFEVHLSHPREKVWRALTQPELLSEWLLPVTGLRLEVGAPFTFKTAPHPGWDGTVDCRLLSVTPLEEISYAWDVGGMELRTVVSFTLRATDTGTLMTIVQSGFTPAQRQNAGGARYGWKMMSTKLEALLGAAR